MAKDVKNKPSWCLQHVMGCPLFTKERIYFFFEFGQMIDYNTPD